MGAHLEADTHRAFHNASLDSLRPAGAVVIGDLDDPHVEAVLQRLPRQATAVLDAATLPAALSRLSPLDSVVFDRSGQPVRLSRHVPARGWIRRLAPAGWDAGVELGGQAAARMAARMTTLAAVLRDAGLTWLCTVDALFTAENKIVQYRTAAALGVAAPATLVCGDPAVLAAELGEPFIIKPLGPGNFAGRDRSQHIVHAQEATGVALTGVDLLDAPFLAQRKLHARTHLRVVTVNDRAWTAELDATGLPLDWRQADEAHHAFTASTRWPAVEHDAVRLAKHLNTGFSCQDWIVDQAGPWFVDLNPGGQWLFLPESITEQVADSLAHWLQGI
ncbi:hypothetical protein OIE49_36655 [Streptomyces sp. NBC_01788]|uniref:hypothetical protein n=1 Tax=Streptomyces sp. NBC_01788 TaxID=2975940 RepID=UPI002DD97F73|nr:hypothetical protein [Streptomyces sp. NBC_01788]WSB30923.1 hypothetical protein OIE49_36655 [Streptomyces sp. NBC_01788]